MRIEIGTTISLSKLELKIADIVGQKRYENARSKGYKNRKIGNQSNSFTDINSMAGELAFGKLFNLYPDLRYDYNKLPIYDFMLNDRMTDVKTTHHVDGRLLATKKCAMKKCYYYALMTGHRYESPTYTFRGFVKGSVLFLPENIGNLGHGEGYMVSQDRLLVLEDL